MRYDQIIPLTISNESNLFELTMLDVGPLTNYQINLKSEDDQICAYLISSINVVRGQYYQ